MVSMHKRFVIALCVLVAVLICTGFYVFQAPTAAPTQHVAVSRSNDYLVVNEPTPMQTISSPVRVAGSSNFFEASTRVRIRDSSGHILADTATLAAGWADKLYPFSISLSYSTPSTSQGVVEVFESSAKDGSDIHKISIPIQFRR